VAPTKALVNQIAAEIYARFSKNYPSSGSSIWAIHTRDYRINSPYGCQILVTVPEMFQIMLLSPRVSKIWAPRLRRVIFDEVHSIGNLEGGVIWEQLLLTTTVPLIALSATVGNANEFHEVFSLSFPLLTCSGFRPCRCVMESNVTWSFTRIDTRI